MRCWQRQGVKLREQCNLILRDSHQIERGDGDCQHQGGRGLGQSDMANRCELLQRRELKQAKGAVMPGTKGERTGTGANVFPVVDVVPSAYGWSLSHFHGIYA